MREWRVVVIFPPHRGQREGTRYEFEEAREDTAREIAGIEAREYPHAEVVVEAREVGPWARA